MKLRQLITIADNAYPDGLIMQAYDKDKNPGDTLALFIYKELAETFDETASEKDQLKEAIRVVNSATIELLSVLEAFTSRWRKVRRTHAKRKAEDSCPKP